MRARAKFLTIPINCTEAQVPSLRYGQYLMHGHNHITQAVAAMDSWFALIGAHTPGIAIGSISGALLAYQRPFTAEASASTALSASCTVNKW